MYTRKYLENEWDKFCRVRRQQILPLELRVIAVLTTVKGLVNSGVFVEYSKSAIQRERFMQELQ